MIAVSEKQRKIINDIAQRYSLELILLFGSRVTGKTHKESDFDIGYLGDRRLDLDEEGRLILDLLPIVGQIDERSINLVNIKKALPLLLYAMTSQCQILYEKEPALFATLRAAAFKKYIEMKPLYQEKMRRLGKRISQYKP